MNCSYCGTHLEPESKCQNCGHGPQAPVGPNQARLACYDCEWLCKSDESVASTNITKRCRHPEVVRVCVMTGEEQWTEAMHSRSAEGRCGPGAKYFQRAKVSYREHLAKPEVRAEWVRRLKDPNLAAYGVGGLRR